MYKWDLNTKRRVDNSFWIQCSQDLSTAYNLFPKSRLRDSGYLYIQLWHGQEQSWLSLLASVLIKLSLTKVNANNAALQTSTWQMPSKREHLGLITKGQRSPFLLHQNPENSSIFPAQPVETDIGVFWIVGKRIEEQAWKTYQQVSSSIHIMHCT